MINPFVVRKYGALLFMAFLSTIMFYVGLTFYGFAWAMAWFFGGVLLSVVVGSLLLRNPFTIMLEGKGLLAATLDSTGIIRFFNVGLDSPYMKSKDKSVPMEDVFDRDAVFSLAPPVKASKNATWKDGKLTIELDEEEINKARFGMFHYPVILWNNQLKSIVTKDWLSTLESESFREHGLLYMNRKLEDLTNHVRDFARHIVELTRPKEQWGTGKWITIVVLVIAFIVLAILLAPKLIELISPLMSAGETATSTISSANEAVVLRG